MGVQAGEVSHELCLYRTGMLTYVHMRVCVSVVMPLRVCVCALMRVSVCVRVRVRLCVCLCGVAGRGVPDRAVHS